jgi:putative transposase
MGISPLRRSKQCVYDQRYHFVWIPKYQKKTFNNMMTNRLKEVFQEIAEQYEFEIDTMEIMDDHVYLFLSVPPKYAPAVVVQRMKSISAKIIFQEFPEVKKSLWGGELWNDEYFVRSVGDKVTAYVIRIYIQSRLSQR